MAGSFEYFDQQIMSGLTNVTSGQMMQYSSWMMGLAGSAVTLFVLFKAYQTFAGKLQTPVPDVVWETVRLALVFSFVANAGGYLDGVIDAINGLKEGFSGGDSIWSLLDGLWIKAQNLAKTLHDLDDSTMVKDEGMTAQLLVWAGVMVLMVVCAFISIMAEVVILLLSTTAPIFLFCLAWGWLRPMFNNWMQNIFASILTIMFAALTVRLVVTYLNNVLDQSASGSASANIVTLGAQVCVAGIMGAILIYASAMVAKALAGASAGVAMQGLASAGVAFASFGAASQVSSALKGSSSSLELNKQGWADAAKGQGSTKGGEVGYRASQARDYAKQYMQQRSDQRDTARTVANSSNVVNARNRFGS